MSDIIRELQRVKQASQEQTAASQRLSTDVMATLGEIDLRFNQVEQELSAWQSSVKAKDLDGEPRYITEITITGDKNTFYPVFFTMPSGDETTIQIYRHSTWNNNQSGGEASDFDTTKVASALVILKGQTNSLNGDANYLRTVVNYQRYRSTVANVAFLGYVHRVEKLPEGAAYYPSSRLGYFNARHSGFMLRGGKLKYQIIANKPIDFLLPNEGELLAEDGKWFWWVTTLPLSDFKAGDSNNNHPTTYISY
ncbi:hypothetical protein L4D77_26265 [Photobacterium frigidiphilum]|uniref:hypothetical protein n=1 Tax=Photobacterium frigidiphilum TaxID=264736 RepID=UPI003D0E810C